MPRIKTVSNNPAENESEREERVDCFIDEIFQVGSE